MKTSSAFPSRRLGAASAIVGLLLAGITMLSPAATAAPAGPNGPQGTDQSPTPALIKQAESSTISSQQIIANAWNWYVTAGNPPYSQTDYWHSRTDYWGDGKGSDPTPGSNYPSWREDCSGFVSRTWGFADMDGGFTTYTVGQYSHPISWADLLPGDALLLNGVTIGGVVYDHMGLFMGWNSNGTYNVMDETRPGQGTRYQTNIPSDDGFWQYAQPIQYNGFTANSLTGEVTYAPGSSGSLQEVFVHNTAGTVYESWEVSDGSWTKPTSLGGDITSTITYAPGIGTSLQELFGVGPKGQLYEDYETAGGHWSGWNVRGVTNGVTLMDDLSYGPGPTTSASTTQELFGLATTGAVYEIWQTCTTPTSGTGQCTWSLWNTRGGDMHSDVTVAPGNPNLDTVQEIWARNTNGNLFEESENNSYVWGNWVQEADQAGQNEGMTSNLTYAPGTGGTTGSLQEIWGIKGSSGNVFETWENQDNQWVNLNDRAGVMTGNLTYAPGPATGDQEIWARNTNGTAFEDWWTQNTTTGQWSWSGWNSRGGDSAGDLTYAPGSHGSQQEIFAVQPSGAICQTYENTNNTWTTWHTIGTTGTCTQ
jgi:hypothetical protein